MSGMRQAQSEFNFDVASTTTDALRGNSQNECYIVGQWNLGVRDCTSKPSTCNNIKSGREAIRGLTVIKSCESGSIYDENSMR
jgi:hypothetical protein